MDEKILKDHLEDLKIGLEGKSKEHAATVIKDFEQRFETAFAEKVKASVADETKALIDVNAKISEEVADLKKVQGLMDAKMKEPNFRSKEKKSETFANSLNESISENFESISKVRKGQGFNMEVKTVANMLLSADHLTGDEPRSYSNTVAAVPSQLINFSDLITSINIGGGTYTFPREGVGEGSPATQTEGSDKAQVDFDFTMVDVVTDFLAGYANYSKKMANNLPFLQSFLPNALRRDYLKAESAQFAGIIETDVTASTQIITGVNKAEMLMNDVASLEEADFSANGITLRPAEWYNIAQGTYPSSTTAYSLPFLVEFTNGVLTVNGIPVYKATWMTANKYFVGDWTTLAKVVTEGLSVQFSTEDEDNFRKNAITARIEAQIALAIHRVDAFRYGDFTAT